MRKLVNYFKSLFCKHDWELIFDDDVVDTYWSMPCGRYAEKVYRHKICGMEKRYKSGK